MRQIIMDSGGDMTLEMRDEMNIVSVPLTMTLGEKEFCDDEHLDMNSYLEDVKNYKGKAGSASPSPFLFQEAIEGAREAYVITLSSRLSGSYNNAVIGSRQVEEVANSKALIFDSKSASAGETLLAIKLHDLLETNIPKEKIGSVINKFIDGMKTYFVLEKYDNLQKNGRLNKVTGSLIQLLNIKLIMGADGNGEIALYKKCRGRKNVLEQLLSLIEKSGKKTKDEIAVISHNNNDSLAEQLAELIRKRFAFKRVHIVPTGGLSSLYADDKGIVLAF